MKRISYLRAFSLLFVISLHVTGKCTAEEEPLTLLDVYDSEKGVHYSWRVDIPVVKTLPQGESEDKPALSMAEAIRIARRSMGGSQDSSAYQLFSICLRQPAKVDKRINISSPIFYFVTFRSRNPSDQHQPRDIAVLLNGQVVEPLIEPIKK
jgi:hypothetical protein